MGFDHPVLQSLVLPLALTMMLTVLTDQALSARWVRDLTTASIGIVFDIAQPNWVVRAVALTLGVVAIALWLAWSQLGGGDLEALLWVTAACSLALVSLSGLAGAPREGTHRPAMIVVTVVALAGASLNASSLALFQIGVALAAAVGGFALWNWPGPRLPFGAGGIAVGGLGCFSLALLLPLLTRIQPWALLPRPLVFVGAVLAHRLPVPSGYRRATVEPLYIVLIGAVSAALTVQLAEIPAPSDDLYYR